MSFVTGNLGFRLKHHGPDPATPRDIDISTYVETIDKFTNVGNGEIPTAKVMLDSREGEFITNSSSGKTPIFAQYDYLELLIEDDDKNRYNRILVMDDIAPQKNESGSHVVIDLVGRERFLQKMYMSGYYPWISFKDMILRIQKFYNDNKKPFQPSLTLFSTDLNAFPTHAFGTFDFGTETTIYDALQDVVHRLTLPAAAGGAGEQYAVVEAPSDIATFLNRVALRIVPRGHVRSATDAGVAAGQRRATPHIAKGGLNFTRVKSPESGNAVLVTGQEGAGSYPREVAEFRSLMEEFVNLPEYVVATPSVPVSYKKNSFVRYAGDVWCAKRDVSYTAMTTVPTIGNDWKKCTFADYVKEYKMWYRGGTQNNTYTYSPWTHGKATDWSRWGGNPPFMSTKAGFGRNCFPDSNLVVRESSTNGSDATTVWRDWVDYLFDNTSNPVILDSPHEGARLLIKGSTLPRGFSTTDEFNVPYANSMVQYVNDKWVVFRTAEQFDECAVIDTGRIYQYNTAASAAFTTLNIPNVNRALRGTSWKYGNGKTRPSSSSSDYTSTISGIEWRDISDTLMGNDTFHYPSTVSNVRGLIASDLDDSRLVLDSQYTSNSAIRITYNHVLDDIIQQLANIFSPIAAAVRFWNFLVGTDEVDTSDPIPELTNEQKQKLRNVDFYNDGWWCTLFEAPFPKNTKTIYKRGVFDLYNLNETPKGNVGYNQDGSDQLGAWDGIGFWFNFNISGITLREFDGNIPFRCVIYDIFGGVWKSDFVIRFQDESQYVRIPFSSFGNYRSRLPVAFAISNWVQRAKNPELRETEIFNKYFLKRIVLHTLWSYDDQGRYDPLKWDAVIYRLLPTLAGTSTTVTYSGTVDGFHFTRKPTAIARNALATSKRFVMDKVKKYPHVSNQIQLQKIATSELDISQHQEDTVEFQIDDQTDSIKPCVLTAEQTVRVEDQDFILDTIGSATNQRDYIVEKITYSVGDRSRGSGLVATIMGRRKLAT